MRLAPFAADSHAEHSTFGPTKPANCGIRAQRRNRTANGERNCNIVQRFAAANDAIIIILISTASRSVFRRARCDGGGVRNVASTGCTRQKFINLFAVGANGAT